MSKGRFIAALFTLFCLLALPATASAMKFAAPGGGASITDSSMRANVLVSADFNGDGLDDIAAGVQHNGIQIRLANSNGSWTTGTTVDNLEPGAYSLATGDFNKDGKADLVEWKYGGGNYYPFFQVFLGNGDGTFGGGIDINGNLNSPSNFYAVSAGDADSDGNPDVLIGMSQGEFAIAYGNGSGGFTTPLRTQIPGAPHGFDDRTSSVAVGDFNDDGKNDLALAISNASDRTQSAIYLLLGNGTRDLTTSPSPNNPFPVGQPGGFIDSIKAADFDGDGNTDLAASVPGAGSPSSTSASSIQIWHGDDEEDMVANPLATITVSSPNPEDVNATRILANNLRVGDFDTDGKTDLAWFEYVQPNGPSEFRLMVARNMGNNFITYAGGPWNFPDASGSPWGFTIGDFNGDDAPDFAMSGIGTGIGGTFFLQNQIDLSFFPEAIDFGDVIRSNTTATSQVQIFNSGGPDAHIDAVALTGSDRTKFTLPTECAGQITNSNGGCTQHIKFTPNQDPGTYSANVHVTFAGSSESLDIPVSAKIVVPRVAFDPTSLGFGELRPGQARTLTVVATNTGDASLTFMPDAPINDNSGGYFAKTSDSCSGTTIGPGATCSVSIKATGDNAATGNLETAELHLASDGYQSQTDINLSFTGIKPGIDVESSNGQFGSVSIGNSNELTFAIDSNGATDLAVTDLEISGNQDTDFRLGENSTDCVGTYAPNDGCEVTVEFRPQSTSPSLRTGQITIQSNTQDAAIIIPLAGTAVRGDAAYSPNEIDFGDVTVGQSSIRTVTVTSNGTAPVEADEIWVDGPNGPRDVSVASETCSGHEIEVGQTCAIELKLTPTERGGFDDVYAGLEAPAISDEIHITGKGVSPGATVDASSYDFGEAMISGAGEQPKHAFTLTSTGLDPVKVASLAIDGPDADSFRLADPGVCAVAIPVNEKCQVTVVFDPKPGSAGARHALFSATTTGGVVKVDLTGTAVNPEPSPPGPTYEAKMAIKFPKKVKVRKKTRIKVKVTVTNTGTGTLSGAALTYTAKQGSTGRTKDSRRVALPSVPEGKSIRKTITINLRKSQLIRGKMAIKLNFNLVHEGTTLAARRGTTRLDFGQAKMRRPKDISNT